MKRIAARNSFWLVLSLALFLLSGLGSALVQTAGGSVTMKTLTWETPSGLTQSAYLFVPNDASAEDPRPAIVLAHGYNNQKQMQDNNYVELAKRGYVVMSIDRYSHGDSSNQTAAAAMTLSDNAAGVYDSVIMLSGLPYVDTSRIAVSGHSMGCMSSNAAIALDNEAPQQLIAAAYLVDCSPVTTDADGAFADIYGGRDVAVYADQYDEFFFRSYDADGALVTTPREYITTAEAQSFLRFGVDPAGEEARESYTSYTQSVDGQEAIRRIDNPAEIHPWATFSTTAAHDIVTFFDEAFGAPHPIDASSQTWQIKAAFNGLGLVALGIFVVAFSRALLATRLFAGLRADTTDVPASPKGRDLAWLWGSLALSVAISAVSFQLLAQSPWSETFTFTGTPGINPQGPTSFIGLWAAFNGLVAIALMFASYRLFGARRGQDLRAIGVLPGWRKFWLGVLLAAVVVLAFVLILFVTEYFFQSDWRLYVLGIATFNADKIGLILLYLPLFLAFYVFNSVAMNSFNRFTVAGREWLNTLILATVNALPAIILVAIQYIIFAITGELAWHDGESRIAGIWLQFVIPFLFVAVIISRKIYRSTNNPYIGGIIMAAIATIGSVSTTITIAG
ncbi:alpha/beta hydrolase family protein [Microbacterium sp. ZW T5_56]|uniref:alpha/beta hydrolase family protein n=1 Tax=Microbacterium sp. ZW T5_56 TaxID=3378081 RepID=UPI0038529269